MTRETERWLQAVHAEAAASQDDPRRDAAFQAWKDGHERRRKKNRPDRRGVSAYQATAGRRSGGER